MQEKVGYIKKTDIIKVIWNLIDKWSEQFPWRDFSYAYRKHAIDFYGHSWHLYLIWEYWNKYHVASFIFEVWMGRSGTLVRKIKLSYINPNYVK